MRRSHVGYHRSTIFRRIKRRKRAYFDAFADQLAAQPSTSSTAGDESAEEEMPDLTANLPSGMFF